MSREHKLKFITQLISPSSSQTWQVTMSILAALCVLIITIWCLKVMYGIWWWPKLIEKKLKKQGIPGPPYTSLYGNLKEMMRMSKEAKSRPMPLNHDIAPRLNPFLHQLATRYKKIFVFWAGPCPRVTIMDPKLIREVMLNKSGYFRKPELTAFLKLFSTGLGVYNGEKWAKHRRILNPAFHMEKLKRMFPAFSVSSDELISRWSKLVGSTGSCELDVSPEFLNLAGDVLSRAAFGSSFEEGRSIFLLQREQCELIMSSNLTIIFSWLRFLPTKNNRKIRYIYKHVRALLRCIIEKREKAILSGMTYNEDLLGTLLKSRNDDLHENNKNCSNAGLSTEDVINECKTFYFAGQDTTGSLLTWTMIVLSMHTNWQEQAREEVLRIIGKNKAKVDDLSQLKIMSMILYEVLRLYPPFEIIRATSKQTKLGDYLIPSGVQLYVPLHIIHRDSELWGDDALTFNPERFSEGVSKIAKDGKYIPFGWGPRICIGMNFAMLEVKLVLSQILQNFSFRLSPSYTHVPSLTIILQPKYGAQIILQKL